MKKNAYFWNIPCYFDPATGVLVGRNRFYDKIVRVALRIHSALTFVTAVICTAFNIEYEGFFQIDIEEE